MYFIVLYSSARMVLHRHYPTTMSKFITVIIRTLIMVVQMECVMFLIQYARALTMFLLASKYHMIHTQSSSSGALGDNNKSFWRISCRCCCSACCLNSCRCKRIDQPRMVSAIIGYITRQTQPKKCPPRLA
mmetsp:Transcript_11671/g.32192  ORF Transcript_11671/g.32192 Transcript_11671/m.32192 type:complete len:131 (-) Transcript_11671:1839-2231(-)